MTIDPTRRKLIIATGAAALGSAALLAHAQSQPRVINIVAKKFEFVPAEIPIKLGETVTLQFTAPEVAMGFALADYKVRADIVPGKTTVLQFKPDKAGKFLFECDVFCGDGHEDMSGHLVVT